MRRATRLLQPFLRSYSQAAWLEPLGLGLKSVRGDQLQQQAPLRLPSLPQSVYRGAGANVHSRHAASSATDSEVETINRMFAECRDEIEMCREDAGTVYFNESAEEARKLVKDTLYRWDTLLESLAKDEKERLVRSMGLKMEQLKAELAELDHLHDDHD